MPPPRRVEDMVELVEEILLRLPPDEPASLVRAALVCKPWCSLLSSHRFRRLYRDFHKTPPILGFFHDLPETAIDCNYLTPEESSLLTPASTKGFCPRDPQGSYVVYDCRHGRVLLYDDDEDQAARFVVWDPMTGSQRPLLAPDITFFHRAAVLCAVGGCDHAACHMGPFLVVYISFDLDYEQEEGAWVHVYSSKTCKWSERPYLRLPRYCGCEYGPLVLVAEAFYFVGQGAHHVIKYDLRDERLSVFNLPPMVARISEMPPALVTSEDGGLGLAHLDKFILHMWSYDDGVALWTHHRVIDLKMLLPIGDPMISPQVAGSVEGTRTIFVVTDLGAYMIDLNSLTSRKNEDCIVPLSKKIYSILGRRKIAFYIFPYVSFFNRPVAAAHFVEDNED